MSSALPPLTFKTNTDLTHIHSPPSLVIDPTASSPEEPQNAPLETSTPGSDSTPSNNQRQLPSECFNPTHPLPPMSHATIEMTPRSVTPQSSSLLPLVTGGPTSSANLSSFNPTPEQRSIAPSPPSSRLETSAENPLYARLVNGVPTKTEDPTLQQNVSPKDKTGD